MIHRYIMMLTISKPKRVGKNSATAINHIIANCIVECWFKTFISKTDVADHFPCCYGFRNRWIRSSKPKGANVQKRNYDKRAIESFKQRLQEIDWVELKNARISIKHVNIFLKHIFQCDNFFPKVKVSIKTKNPRSPWTAKGIAKSSKRNQKLYEKNLKRRTNATETAYKLYKNLFESISGDLDKITILRSY